MPQAAKDMTDMDWRGLMRGLFKFLSEEAAEPEHSEDQLITEPNSAIPAAGVMLMDPMRRILFVKRSGEGDHEDEWCLPGGRCEGDEAAIDCAKRETKEEIGYDCAGALPSVHKHSFDGVDFETFVALAPCRFKPRLNSEHTAYTWAPWGAWPVPLHPGVAATLAALQDDVDAGEEVDLADLLDGGESDGGADAKMATDPLTEKGRKILAAMQEKYGEEKGEQVFYASKNKGTISGVDGVSGGESYVGKYKVGYRISSDNMALDRASARSYDADGRMHVDFSNISKATVNPYYGREIPDYEKLGLQPDKKYRLLRDPKELQKGIATFNNLPILARHVPVSADAHQPELVIGSTGTDAEYKHPYLKNSLVLWAKPAIDGVESGDQRQLSAAYRYKADMTPGVYEGEKYDGVMRDIIGNHVALVKEGRAGPDVVVGDSKIPLWRSPKWPAVRPPARAHRWDKISRSPRQSANQE